MMGMLSKSRRPRNLVDNSLMRTEKTILGDN